jgi:hypothetical protein
MTTSPAEVSAVALRDDDPPKPWDRELIKLIAMDIGKEVAAHIEVMYPEAVKAASSTFLLSLRNSIHNEIIAAIEVNDAGQIQQRLDCREYFRRKWKAAYKKLRAHT